MVHTTGVEWLLCLCDNCYWQHSAPEAPASKDSGWLHFDVPQVMEKVATKCHKHGHGASLHQQAWKAFIGKGLKSMVSSYFTNVLQQSTKLTAPKTPTPSTWWNHLRILQRFAGHGVIEGLNMPPGFLSLIKPLKNKAEPRKNMTLNKRCQ